MPSTTVFTMAALCQEYLSAKGYEVADVVGTRTLIDEIERMPQRAPVTPMLSPRRNYFSAANSFWLIIRHEGEIVGTLGARYDDTGDTGLSSYLTRLHDIAFGSDGNTAVVSRLPRHVEDISGGLIYMGDVFFHPDHRGDIAKTQCFCQLAFCMAFARWWQTAGWIVAMHRQIDILAGKGDQYGFTTGRYPAAQAWLNAPTGRSGTEYLSLLSRDDFERNIRVFIEDPDSLVSPPVRPRSQRASGSPSRSSK